MNPKAIAKLLTTYGSYYKDEVANMLHAICSEMEDGNCNDPAQWRLLGDAFASIDCDNSAQFCRDVIAEIAHEK